MTRTTVELDIPKDPAERLRLELESIHEHRVRIVEVLRKYGVELPQAPLDALALAMKKMGDNRRT